MKYSFKELSLCSAAVLLIVFLISGCTQHSKHDPGMYQNKDLLRDIEARNSEGMLNVVIEITAGSNEKWEVSKETGKLAIDYKDGKPRIVKYLPYPWNYGMVPRSLLPKHLGGDGDPLDVVVLGPVLQRGEVASVKVIGVMQALDSGEQDDKIIAVLKGHPLFVVNSIEELDQEFPGVTSIISTWYANYKGPGVMQVKRFAGPMEAKKIIDTAVQHYRE